MDDWNTLFRKASGFHGEVTSRITYLDPEAATQAMAEGYKLVTGKYPSAKVLSLMTGQWALETGNGKQMRNYNFGNKKATGSEDYQYFRCSEVIDGKELFFDPPHPSCRFASYDTPAKGAAAYVRTLKSRDHWWKGLHTGTAEGFIEGLTTRPAYFTANPATYQYVLENRADAFKPYAVKYGGSGSILTSMLLLGAVYFGWKHRARLIDEAQKTWKTWYR
jgi:hypothetical protein